MAPQRPPLPRPGAGFGRGQSGPIGGGSCKGGMGRAPGTSLSAFGVSVPIGPFHRPGDIPHLSPPYSFASWASRSGFSSPPSDYCHSSETESPLEQGWSLPSGSSLRTSLGLPSATQTGREWGLGGAVPRWGVPAHCPCSCWAWAAVACQRSAGLPLIAPRTWPSAGRRKPCGLREMSPRAEERKGWGSCRASSWLLGCPALRGSGICRPSRD